MTARRAALLAALAAGVAYWGSLDNGFTWDDHIHIEAAPFVLDAANARTLATPAFWLGRVAVEGSARPLVLASLLADRAAWGGAPFGYHLTNLAAHAGASAALAALASAVASPPVGLLAGLLFALHPVQSEAVCGATFRGDLLAALFSLLALWLARRGASRGAGWAAAAAASFGLGLLSKESAVVTPALWWLAQRLAPPAGARPARERVQLAAFAAVLLAYGAFRVPRGSYESLTGAPATASAPAATPGPSRQYEPSPPPWKAALPTRAARAEAMLGVFADYARLTVWPSGLQADRSPALDAARAPARAAAGALLLAALFAAAWLARRRVPAASLGLAWFAVALAPVSGVVPLYNLIAERYLYLPLAGAALAAAAAVEALARRSGRPKAAYALAAALLAACAVATARRVPAWRDDSTLFAGRVESDGARLRYNRGLLARKAGRLEEARAEYRKALELDPLSVEALVNLSETERSLGATDEELKLLRRAVAVAPRSSVAQEALGAAFERRGWLPDAIDAYRRAVGDDARSASARARLAWALMQTGKRDEALRESAAASKLDPSDVEVQYAAGRIAQDRLQWAAAEAAFRKAVKADPSHGLAWANLGVCLHRRGELKAALGAMKQAARLLPRSADARRNLGALYDDMGRGADAIAAYREATAMDRESVEGWHGYGVVLQKAGRDEEAAVAYSAAIALAPGRPESFVNLAAIRMKEGQVDRARECLASALDAAPGNAVVRAAAAQFQRATGRPVGK